MALSATTLSGAITADQVTIKVASATGFAKGRLIKIDDEFLLQTAEADATATTTIPVRRGVNGTQAKAHVTAALVRVGNPSNVNGPSDWLGSEVTTPSAYPLSGRQRRVISKSAAATLALGDDIVPGTDTVVELNGTSVIALTIPVPTKDMDGDLLIIAGNGAAAHTLTFTGGLSGAGSSYDVLTVNATAPTASMFVAINGLWMALAQIPISGTVTNVTNALA